MFVGMRDVENFKRTFTLHGVFVHDAQVGGFYLSFCTLSMWFVFFIILA